MKLLVCGGMGFIGSAFIRNHLSKNPNDEIINLDKLTTGSNIKNLEKLMSQIINSFKAIYKIMKL